MNTSSLSPLGLAYLLNSLKETQLDSSNIATYTAQFTEVVAELKSFINDGIDLLGDVAVLLNIVHF